MTKGQLPDQSPELSVAAAPPAERRATARRPVQPGEPIAHVRLRAGRELVMLDVGHHGALVEGAARLRPGSHVDAHIVTKSGRVLVRSRVVRASVYRLVADRVTYRCALAFQQPVDTSAPFELTPAA